MTQYPAYVATPQIRWSDLDILGHVNNARMLTLVEQARIDWLNTMRDREAIAAPKLVARVELNYRTPVLYGTELAIQLGIGRVGGSCSRSRAVASRTTRSSSTASTSWWSSIPQRSAPPGSRMRTGSSSRSSAPSTRRTSWT